MVSRLSLSALMLTAAHALSCGVVTPAPGELPAVSAPAAAAPVAGAAQPAVEEPPAPDPLVAAIAGHIGRHRTGLLRNEVQVLAQTIVDEARRYEMDPMLVLAVMTVESRYHNFAVSPVGAMGLMQVMPETGEEIAARLGIAWQGPHTLFDPVANVRVGVAYLKLLADRYDHMPTALAAYNWGPGRIDRRLQRGTPVPEEYARLVTEAYGATRLQRSS
jgi:soluble lytic murein transglycosylase-like protein